MKILFKIIAVCLLIICYSSAQSQGYEFRVLANKGQNSIKAANQEWLPVKTGAKLNKGDEISVSPNGYIGLVHSSGKTIELKTPKTYTVSDLVSKINANSSTITNKYASFVLSQMTKEEGEDVGANTKKNNKATGAVERGKPGEITLYAPNNVNVFGPMSILRWEQYLPGDEYLVTVKNIFDDQVMSVPTTDSMITLDFNDPKLKNEKLLIVIISSKKDAKAFSNQIGIKKLPMEDSKLIAKEFATIMADNNEDTPLNKIIQATFFEQNNLMLDAVTAYESAIKMAPDVPEYKEMYLDFLFRNNLKTE
jgi:hypothetical protein